ncbi:uncharacterized protein [Periplaneta americana]|uniref:uncharacterized protein n=1 Tax=Periplaneta americana TaxID=6978 RepID=UPI0037E911C0
MKSFLTLAIVCVLLIANSGGDRSDETPDKKLRPMLKKMDRYLPIAAEKLNQIQEVQSREHDLLTIFDVGTSEYNQSMPEILDNSIADASKLAKQASTLKELFEFLIPALDQLAVSAKDTQSYLNKIKESS